MQSIRDEIVSAKDPWTDNKISRKTSGRVVSHVAGGLFLGNDEKFVEIVHADNPHQFECALSVCSYTRMTRSCLELRQHTGVQVEGLLRERKIEWLQMGQALPDDKMAWYDLVFNATFTDSKLAKTELEIPRNSREPEHVRLRTEKKEIVERTPVKTWFEKAFSALDKAVNENRKTLVNCHWGISRTGALVAAYLINRYDATPEQAIAFLRTKRNCINPKCVEDLRGYALALKRV